MENQFENKTETAKDVDSNAESQPKIEGAPTETKEKKKSKAGVITAVSLVSAFVAVVLVIGGIFGVGYLFKTSDYNKAVELKENKKYTEAKAAFADLGSFKDSEKQEQICTWLACKKSDVITFGRYEQDNNKSNGSEEIEWKILDIQDDRMLVISKYALDSTVYHTDDSEDITWETCYLRGWLNSEFLNSVFDENERGFIYNATISNPDNPSFWGTDGGNNTTDKLFLLNFYELEKYLPEEENRQCFATDYAIAQGVTTFEDFEDAVKWRLRTPTHSSNVADVMPFGSVDDVSGSLADRPEYGIRPAMWLKLTVTDEDTIDLTCVHEWSDATCEVSKKCSKCGETEGTALGHNYDKYDMCTVCGKDNGKWSVGNYVDEFDRPTGEKFLLNIVEGTFSNSATTNSEHKVRVKYSGSYIAMDLYEYSKYEVNSSSVKEYSVSVLAPNNNTYVFCGLLSGDDMVIINSWNDIDSSKLISLFRTVSGKYTFYIKEKKYGDTYKFEVESSNFAKLYPSI